MSTKEAVKSLPESVKEALRAAVAKAEQEKAQGGHQEGEDRAQIKIRSQLAQPQARTLPHFAKSPASR